MNEEIKIKSSYIRLCTTVLILLFIIVATVELYAHRRNDESVKLYRIEINRVENELKAHSDEAGFYIDVTQYETILSVHGLDEIDQYDMFASNDHYVIREINGRLFRIDYKVDLSEEHKAFLKMTHVIMLIMIVTVVFFLAFIYLSIIRTFETISDYPYKLAKGNLTVPLKENRNRYFGNFLWGLDMLRENLEDERRKNLELHKEKNVFIMSLSHDMKTPISAIKLYSTALKKGLYKDPDKIADTAVKIGENADEIEKYVSGIISASGDDFLDLRVNNSDFYLSSVIEEIRKYYTDKLKNIGTHLTIEDYSDVMLVGDPERVIEVIQNILENAIKYGDGDRIDISFNDEEGARLITVSNSGSTISDKEIPHIFESFYRGSNIKNRQGSGLGLYICKKLLGQMGGEIFAEQADGTFSVTVVLNRR